MIRTIGKLGTAVGVLLGLSGCASSDGGGSNPSGCVPGATNACVGPNGCSGVQACLPDGTGYASCDCGSAGVGGNGGSSGSGAGGTGAGGSGGTAGFGGSSGTGGAPAACELSFSDSACNSCFQTQCVNQCVSCSGNVECLGLNACIGECTTSTCISSCISAFPGGATAFESVLACATSEALCGPVCDTGRVIADSCTHDYQCASEFCTGVDGTNGFCSEFCSNSDACGNYAWCMPNSAGSNICFPACTTSSNCSYLGSGYSCQTWKNVEGYSVSSCGT